MNGKTTFADQSINSFLVALMIIQKSSKYSFHPILTARINTFCSYHQSISSSSFHVHNLLVKKLFFCRILSRRWEVPFSNINLPLKALLSLVFLLPTRKALLRISFVLILQQDNVSEFSVLWGLSLFLSCLPTGCILVLTKWNTFTRIRPTRGMPFSSLLQSGIHSLYLENLSQSYLVYSFLPCEIA